MMFDRETVKENIRSIPKEKLCDAIIETINIMHSEKLKELNLDADVKREIILLRKDYEYWLRNVIDVLT